VREAELRVRAGGSSWPRAEVLVDQDRSGRGTVGRQLAAGEVDKVRREVGRHGEFTGISEQIAEVNEKICEARPAGTDSPSAPEGEKRGSARRSRRRKPPR